MPDLDDDMLHNATWLGGVLPRLPGFMGQAPPVPQETAVMRDRDTIAISLAGRRPETVSLSCLAALLRDVQVDGSVHIGQPDGVVRHAPFALIRRYIFGPAGPGGHLAAR